MNPLPNESHEIFAHIVASGNPPELAYAAVDIIGDPSAARVLVKQPTIAKRIAHLRDVYGNG